MVKYLRFFKEKRLQTLGLIRGDFADTIEDRLRSVQAPYSEEEVFGALEHLEICVKDGVEKDLSRMLSMNVLVLKDLLDAAKDRGLELRVDTSMVENEDMLREAEQIRLDRGLSKRAEPKGNNNSLRRLSSVKNEFENELARQKYVLEDSNKSLQSRFDKLQDQFDKLLREKNTLARQLEDSEGDLRNTIKDLKNNLDRTTHELDTKLSNSKQFQQMKKILSDKNKQVADLRHRLSDYEHIIDSPRD